MQCNGTSLILPLFTALLTAQGRVTAPQGGGEPMNICRGCPARLPAYLVAVVGLCGGVDRAVIGGQLHDLHMRVIDGGIGELHSIRRPQVGNVGFQDLL